MVKKKKVSLPKFNEFGSRELAEEYTIINVERLDETKVEDTDDVVAMAQVKISIQSEDGRWWNFSGEIELCCEEQQ